jgi:hypothetical protein
VTQPVSIRSLLACALLIAPGCVLDRLEPELPESHEHEEEEHPAPLAPSAEQAPASLEEIPASEPAPLAAPLPAPFAGRERVRVDELLVALADEVAGLAVSDDTLRDYEAFLLAFELQDSQTLYLDYIRIKLAFEATRAGGWWGLAWNITNEEPRSDEIWAHWQTLELGAAPATIDELAPLPDTTAIAECDELSALFAFVAQRIGLSKTSEVGLFWPTGNHTVAVWTIDAKSDAPKRIVIPTSQIFLDGAQTLGTREFNPWRQNKIFDYRRQDAAAKLELPGALASAFVLAVREQGMRPQAELQKLRNDKESRQWQAIESMQ